MHHAHEWSPLRVLTPHFQIESLLSRPLDERAMVPRSGIEPNFLRTSKARERTSATGIKINWGERRESNPHRPGHSGTCRPLHHEHHEVGLAPASRTPLSRFADEHLGRRVRARWHRRRGLNSRSAVLETGWQTIALRQNWLRPQDLNLKRRD